MTLRPSIAVVLCSLVLVVGFLAGCDDDTAPPVDARATTEAGADMAAPTPDMAGDAEKATDTFLWPDKGPDPDLWPQYSGGQFGCKNKHDCFGQKCCPTPWGIKICAPTCNWGGGK